jgi:phosphoribosylformylglycinamidine cyclo-ligase
MAAIVAADRSDDVASALEGAGETVFAIGRIEEGPRGCTVSGSATMWNAHKDWSATHNA